MARTINRINRILAAACPALLFPSLLSAVPALDLIVEQSQPDGSRFQIIQRGDEWDNHIETPSGYTVARGGDGVWRYVRSYGANRQPVLGPTAAHLNAPSDLPKHLSPPSRRPQNVSGGESATGAGPSSVPLQTSQTPVLFLLADFTDRAGVTSESDWSVFIQNNIRDFYSKNSYGKADIVPANESFGTSNDGVVGWLNVGYPHPNTGGNTGDLNRQLTKDAILAADSYVDYSQFDTNGNGTLESNELSVVLIAAGYETSYGGTSGALKPNVWGHRWSFWGPVQPPLVDGVRIYDYAQFGEFHATHTSNSHQATMGIMVHELGHLAYGLPDLYDTDGSSAGIGPFGLMSSGSWGRSSSDAWSGETPVSVSAWSKYSLGWVHGNEGVGTESIVAGGDATANPDNAVFRTSSSLPDEYFLVENRNATGYDRGLERWFGSSFGGLAIWHIDDTQTNNRNDSRRWVDLEEADGSVSANSSADLWRAPGTTSFNDSTNPNSDLYSGSSSGVDINSISAPATQMTASFGVATNDPPTAVFTYSPADLAVSFTDTSSDSDGSISSWSWNFGDGNTSAAQNPSHTYTAGGTYTVTLTVTDNDGDSNTVNQSVTVTAPVVNDPPTAAFTYSPADLAVSFTDTSSDSDGSISSWSWNFGDGNTSAAQNPSHTYTAGGTYTVTLTVTDNDGVSDAISQSVTVTAPVGNQQPAAPTNLTASVQTTGKGKNREIIGVALSWSDNSDNEDSFIIERCEQVGSRKNKTCTFGPHATVGENITSYSENPGSGTFKYRVKARNTHGDSAYTNEVKI